MFIIARQSNCANEFYEGPLCFCPFMINAHSTHHWFSVTDSVVWEPIDPFWSCESEPYVSLFTFKIGRAALQGEGHSCARTVQVLCFFLLSIFSYTQILRLELKSAKMINRTSAIVKKWRRFFLYTKISLTKHNLKIFLNKNVCHVLEKVN